MLPPGPRTPALWQTYRFVTRPAEYVRSMKETYGDAVAFHSLAGRGIAVMEPELAREVFGAPPDTFEAVPLIESLFGSTAVIAVSGERHKKLRKLLNPRFHGQKIKGFLTAMQRAVRAALEGFASTIGTGRVVTMTDVTQAMALDVIIETVFGAQELDRDVARAILVGVVRGFTPSIVGGNALHKSWFPPWRRYVRACAAFDRWVLELVRQRRARGADAMGDDVLGVLLCARYEDGSPMDDTEVRDQLFTLLLAGHETSAIAMAWCAYYLLRTPAVLARLRDEVDALGPQPSAEAVTKLRYLDAVACEALRIQPIVTDVIRVCREPFTLAGRWTLPKGNVIAVMLGSILRDARVFPDPDVFRPERFLEKSYGASEFLPFGGGARRCLGAAFAQSELTIAVAEIASRWDLELASTEPETAVRRNVTMGPKHGVRVRVLARRTPAAWMAAS